MKEEERGEAVAGLRIWKKAGERSRKVGRLRRGLSSLLSEASTAPSLSSHTLISAVLTPLARIPSPPPLCFPTRTLYGSRQPTKQQRLLPPPPRSPSRGSHRQPRPRSFAAAPATTTTSGSVATSVLGRPGRFCLTAARVHHSHLAFRHNRHRCSFRVENGYQC